MLACPPDFDAATLKRKGCPWVTTQDPNLGCCQTNGILTSTSMAKEPTYFLLKRRLPASVDLLGRITDSFQDPTGGSYTPEHPSSLIGAEEILETKETKFELNAKSTQHQSRGARLCELLQSQKSTSSDSSLYVDSPQVTSRHLTQYRKVFERLKNVDEIRDELQDVLPVGGQAYMIVGTMSINNALAERHGHASRELDMDASLPTVDTLTGIPTGTDISSVGTSASKKSSNHWTLNSRTDGWETFAVQYRVIKRSWGGFGKRAIFTNREPEYQGNLTYGNNDATIGEGYGFMEAEEDEDSQDDEADVVAEISEEVISLEDAPMDRGKAPILDAELGLLYYLP